MTVFINITDADVGNPSFWGGLNVGPNSTINATAVSDTTQIILGANSIAFTDTTTGTVTTYSDADLAGGSFSQFVEFLGNDADNNVSGSVGLNAGGYVGGAGNDTLQDDGSIGGQIDGGDGDDVLIGGIGSNNIEGGDGDDLLLGGDGGNNNLNGGDGNDTLIAGEGSGNLTGGAGDDVLFAGNNSTFVTGNSGNDSLVLPEGSMFEPFFDGSTGGNATLPGGSTLVYTEFAGGVRVACFVAGALIQTPSGERPVETLCAGDLVCTKDNGAQPISWTGCQRVAGQGRHAPIRFLPGSIGNDRVLFLSPQHRVLLSGWRCELFLESAEVLCAAKHLCDGNRIRRVPFEHVDYIHFMFENHEVVFAEGAAVESFFVGDYICAPDAPTYSEITDLFPELRGVTEAYSAARPIVKGFEASLLRV